MALTTAEKKQRAARLKALREDHAATVDKTQAHVKAQQAVRREIKKVLRDGPKTVPAVAEATGMDPREVLWHLTAMRKYDLVVETGQDGDYYTYGLPEEGAK